MSSATPFNALGGYSVGIPPEVVIDETGNLVNNVNAPNSNVTANRVFANAYFYANGSPLSIGASGSNTQVQYNNNGLLGASSAFTFNSSSNLLTVANLQVNRNANLGNVGNVTILGGNNGYFLQTDGAGSLTWAPATGGNGGNGTPGGANSQVQFNDAGVFGGDAGFVYDKVANVMTVGNVVTANITADYIVLNWDVTANVVFANYLDGDGSNITNVHAITSDVAYSVAGANVTGQVNFAAVANSVAGANVTGQVAFANVANNVAAANIIGQVANALVAGTVYTSAQPNITSVGNLTSLTVVGNTTLGNQVVSNYFIGNLFGVANLARNVTLGSQPNITSVGTLTSLTVSGDSTLGNTATANYFVGRLYGVANSATIANTANVATFANTANLANAANLAGTVTVNNQPNITSLGTLTSLSVNGQANLGNVSNVKILGGINGYVLSTDGTGNLSWTAGGGGGGNGNPAGSNTQLQFNNAGNFGASPNLTFNSATNFLLVGGNITATNTVTANTVNSNVVNATNVAISSNLTVPTITASNITAGNITGTLRTNSQPNINYLGSLGWLNVDTDLPNSNGNITFNGSISGVGAASQITITGNINAGNYVEANYFVGEIATNNQPYITNVGPLTSLTVVGNSNLGNAGNVKILGGLANYVLSTDGTGNLSWVSQIGGNTSPGGLNTYIQFNDNGVFGGDNTLTWNKNTDTLFVGGSANISGIASADIFNATAPQGTSPLQVISTTPVANLGVQTADTVRNAAQPNITSVGTLTSLTVSGNINSANLNVTNTFNAGNITTPGTIGTTNLNVTGNGNISGNTVVSGSGTLSINGKFNSAGSSNVNLGNIANLHISGGINGYVLATDGNANLYWTAGGGGGGNGNPGGSNTQIQYNNGGTFGGSPVFTIDAPNANVRLAGNLTTNTFTMGSGVYEFSRSNVYFATTSDTSTQTLLAIPANGIAAVDYTIISTDGMIRNFIKISAVLAGGSLNYVEYSTLPVNGYTGDFVVAYESGNIITPPTIQLTMTPQSANLMTHKMSVTTYKE